MRSPAPHLNIRENSFLLYSLDVRPRHVLPTEVLRSWLTRQPLRISIKLEAYYVWLKFVQQGWPRQLQGFLYGTVLNSQLYHVSYSLINNYSHQFTHIQNDLSAESPILNRSNSVKHQNFMDQGLVTYDVQCKYRLFVIQVNPLPIDTALNIGQTHYTVHHLSL